MRTYILKPKYWFSFKWLLKSLIKIRIFWQAEKMGEQYLNWSDNTKQTFTAVYRNYLLWPDFLSWKCNEEIANAR